MKKRVAFMEFPDGYRGASRSDNAGLGYRKDTVPMAEGVRALGWEADIIFYTHESRDTIRDHLIENCDAYVSRINPGNLDDEAAYFDMLREVEAAGVYGLPGPDQMIATGAKDSLTKLRGTRFALDDTFAYYSLEELKEQFPRSLALGERVLKQNRGSTGDGIWRVEAIDLPEGADSVALDARVKCTEAVDNHVEEHLLGDFLDFCNKYIEGPGGMMLDQRFLPRIKEGEVRVLMLNDKPVNVVHKKPAEGADAFSATLFSGAKYTYEPPEDWPQLLEPFVEELPLINEKLGGYPSLPLIWTADFILDTGPDGEDTYVLGELNCSCVGFTSQLDLAPTVVKTLVDMVGARTD